MIDIDNELEDIIPTYDADADIDVVELLKNSTSLGIDEDGNEIPGYIFAGDIADMLELSERDLAKFAQDTDYEILSAKIVGEELPAEMLVICRKGFDQDVLKTDYKEIFELDLELTPVENLNDSEDGDKGTKANPDESHLLSKEFLDSIKDDKESDEEESKESLKIESVADDKKELGYLWRKEKVSPLDKFEVSEWSDDIDFTVINENVIESNELEKSAKRHKKTDRKGARGWFVNSNAGNVKQNLARANHMMGDGSVASSETVGSAPAGLGEEVKLDEMLPHKDESKTDFVSRFMSDDKMIKEYENPKQRYAVAISYWEKK